MQLLSVLKSQLIHFGGSIMSLCATSIVDRCTVLSINAMCVCVGGGGGGGDTMTEISEMVNTPSSVQRTLYL
jgi:hypothetical protein